MKIKFTIIDYIIIILVICAIAFAFIHITSDDSSSIQKTAFDESTINKIPDTYLKYYKDGYIVNATIEGYNSTNNEPVTLTGNVVWVDDDDGTAVKLLINSENKNYLTGFYRYSPNVDVYIDHISLEVNDEKYQNLSEIKIKPEKITSLNELISDIDNDTNFEISTQISTDSLSTMKIQEVANKLLNNDKRISISSNDLNNKIILNKATKENINDADSILGNFDGMSEEITIRIYNSTDSQLDTIKNNYDVSNIRNF